jgi:hypothetical protein
LFGAWPKPCSLYAADVSVETGSLPSRTQKMVLPPVKRKSHLQTFMTIAVWVIFGCEDDVVVHEGVQLDNVKCALILAIRT